MGEPNANELYRRYRPTMLKEVLGQESAINCLRSLLKSGKFPRALLLVGHSGCGKTTVARILSEKLGCSKHDFDEVNCAASRGIDTIRDIQSRVNLSPVGGKCRVWLLDEVHQWSGAAASAMFKTLEDVPSHVYFMLATTDPQKLLKPIITRCTQVKFRTLKDDLLTTLVRDVLNKEQKTLSDLVISRVVEAADGSARQALTVLGKIIDIEDQDDQLEGIKDAADENCGEGIAQLLFKPGASWREMTKVLKEVTNDEESVRHAVLAYAIKVLQNPKSTGKWERARQVIHSFEGNFFDSKKAGLVASCYDLINT